MAHHTHTSYQADLMSDTISQVPPPPPPPTPAMVIQNMASPNTPQLMTPPPTTAPTPAEAQQAHTTLFAHGLSQRTHVIGAAHTTHSLTTASPFTRHMQDYATAVGWGMIWQRAGLTLAQRSMVVLAILGATGAGSPELAAHVRGAVRNGLSEAEIRETLLHVAGYAGFPKGMEAFRVAEAVLDEMERGGEVPEGWREKRTAEDGEQGGVK